MGAGPVQSTMADGVPEQVPLPSSAPPQAASSAGSMSTKRCGGSQPDRFAEVVASGQPTASMSARASLLPGMRKAMVPSAER